MEPRSLQVYVDQRESTHGQKMGRDGRFPILGDPRLFSAAHRSRRRFHCDFCVFPHPTTTATVK